MGKTVLPLPFHGMSSYPPGEKDVFPSDPGIQKYLREYNTRKVTAEDYRREIKDKKQ
jgi:hypothetical protein